MPHIVCCPECGHGTIHNETFNSVDDALTFVESHIAINLCNAFTIQVEELTAENIQESLFEVYGLNRMPDFKIGTLNRNFK